MDGRLHYLLVLLPPLPALGEAPAFTLAQTLERLRQQGGRDLEELASVLGLEQLLREDLEDWVGTLDGSRREPRELSPAFDALFAEETVSALPEGDWVTAVWRAYLRLLAETGRRVGSRLLPRWAGWEDALRARLARRRGGSGQDAGVAASAEDEAFLAAAIAEWARIREQGGRGAALAAAMEAEVALDRARLAFLTAAARPYSFSLDELVSYLLRLRVLERYPRLDPAKGRHLLKEVASL